MGVDYSQNIEIKTKLDDTRQNMTEGTKPSIECFTIVINNSYWFMGEEKGLWNKNIGDNFIKIKPERALYRKFKNFKPFLKYILFSSIKWKGLHDDGHS